MKRDSLQSQQGVSLAELAVVVTIIGLLTGVVVAGAKIQKASELQSIIKDIGSFQVAVESFDYKYSALPGDMADAYDYWGATCDATNTNCNGNGNDAISIGSGGSDSESYRAWQHLLLAGFIEGGYTGTATGTQGDIGINIPASKRTPAGYTLAWDPFAEALSNKYFAATHKNYFILGGFAASDWAWTSILTPTEAYTIDKKMDDGKPYDGKVYGLEGTPGTGTNCRSTNATGSAYQTTTITTASCIMAFPLKP